MTYTVVNSFVVLPDWLDPSHIEQDDSFDFCVTVHWRGGQRFCVAQGITEGRYRLLSRQGEWKLAPTDEERDNYRFTLGEAMSWARRVVNHTRVNGRTHEEWERYWSERETSTKRKT